MKNILLLTLLCLSFVSFSQSTYNVSYQEDTGNPGGFNNEDDNVGQGTWTTIQTGSQPANVWSAVQTLPFAFEFFGSPVTQFKASQNCLLTFDVASALLPNANENLPSANLPDSTICAFWDEFTASAPTGAGDDIRTNVYGTAPNRQFWVRWYSFEMGNPANSFNYFSIVLEETTNNIYVVDMFCNSTALTATVGVQLNATTAIQFGTNNLNHATNGSAATDNDYYLFAPELLVPDNIGVVTLDNPTLPINLGLQNIDVTVQNFGTNDVSSFDIAWEVNGTPQTPYTYTGGIIPSTTPSASLNIGSYNFPNGFTTLKFWTENPNGVPDGNPTNDTLEISACAALSGTYTIGGATPDFVTINDAVTALNTCGVGGPVVFEIAPGTYNEQITLIEVTGASATNTITFDGGNASTTTITSDQSALQWATIGHDGADFVTWKNLTVETTATTDGAGFGYSNDATFNTVDSCIILMDAVTTGVTDLIGIMVSGSLTNNSSHGLGNGHNTFSNNEIIGGEIGINVEGSTAFADWTNGISITNNVFRLMDDFGVYFDNADTLTISGNQVFDIKVNTGDGIYCIDIANFDISSNEVYAPDWCIYIGDGNFDGPVVGQSSIINNMVRSNTDYGIYLDDIENINIWHNTAYGNPGIRINDFVNLDIRNNIFISDNDYAFESDETVAAQVVDYNLYWTPSSNTLFVKAGPPTYTDLTLWQAADPTLNINSLELEPDFLGSENLRRLGPNGNDLGDMSVGILEDIDGDTRPLGPIVDMGADEYTPLDEDAELIEILSSALSCGDSMAEIFVSVRNLGANDITSLPIQVEATGVATATLNTTYTNVIPFGQIDTILVGTINTYAGGIVNLSGWTSLVGDQDNSNDSTTTTIDYIPFVPVGFAGYSCGTDSADLTGLAGYPVTYEWYDAPSGGNLVGTGNTFTVPSISTQDTYYLQYGPSFTSLFTTLAAGNGCGGGTMFDLVSSSGTILSQIAVHSDATAGSNVPVNVYYITGNTFDGNETNAGLWTSAGSYNVVSGGSGNLSTFLTLSSPIFLPAGQTVAIYVEYDARYTNGTNTYTNGDVTLSTGTGLCDPFANINNDRMFNGELIFGGASCSNVRVPITALTSAGVTVDLGPDITTCGSQVDLDAGNNDPTTTWLWNDATTTQTNSITSPGTYSVLVTDSVGCTGTDTVLVELSNFSLDMAPLSDTACLGDTVFITPVVNTLYPYSFTWSSGQSTEAIAITTPGSYEFVVQDAIGCSDSLTSTISIVPAPTAGFVSTLNSVDIDVISNASNADSVVYDFGDGTVLSGPNHTHTYTMNGNYTVCQYVYNGCANDTICEQVSITQVGLDELSNSIVLQPNPATTELEISIDGYDLDQLEILTTDGRLVHVENLINNQTILNVSELPVGVYFVRVTGSSGQGTRRFVKK